MRLSGAAKLFACQILWRGLHLKCAGRALVSALDADDEDLRVLAGMFLVRAGPRAVPLLGEALAQRRHLPLVVQIIADIGATEFEPELRRLADDPDPQIAQAASDALRQLAGASR
ncbi:MAG TPA: hypothetical protein PLF81_00235 [Candidatus Anammoximicrobium sp.]|nr:hypothetical protein [Candidatus Anammoximicrobium sp.]